MVDSDDKGYVPLSPKPEKKGPEVLSRITLFQVLCKLQDGSPGPNVGVMPGVLFCPGDEKPSLLLGSYAYTASPIPIGGVKIVERCDVFLTFEQLWRIDQFYANSDVELLVGPGFIAEVNRQTEVLTIAITRHNLCTDDGEGMRLQLVVEDNHASLTNLVDYMNGCKKPN